MSCIFRRALDEYANRWAAIEIGSVSNVYEAPKARGVRGRLKVESCCLLTHLRESKVLTHRRPGVLWGYYIPCNRPPYFSWIVELPTALPLSFRMLLVCSACVQFATIEVHDVVEEEEKGIRLRKGHSKEEDRRRAFGTRAVAHT